MADIELSSRDRERLETVHACIAKELINAEAAARLGLSIRQLRRLKRNVRTYGDQGIVHGNRSREPHNATDSRTITTIVAFLKRKDHRDFGPTFAQEQLHKNSIAVLSRETVRAIMKENDLWQPRERKSREIHREWRERRALRGLLVQFDGSYHLWFENRGEEECLLAAIDDADNDVTAVFEDNEGVHAVFRFWDAYFNARGLPVAIYLDKFSTYKINHKSAIDNHEMMTQFKRAMTELGIEVINANSPEAKGRIERLFGTLQDRLVKELRLADIHDRDAANTFLKETYLPDHNKRFKMIPRSAGDAHRPLTDQLRKKLPAILSVQSKRTVNNDFTIQFKNQWYQLDATQETTVFKGDIVTIEERQGGTLHVRLKEIYLAFTALPARPKPTRMKVTALTREKPRAVPPPGHPWRRAAAAERERAEFKKSRNAR